MDKGLIGALLGYGFLITLFGITACVAIKGAEGWGWFLFMFFVALVGIRIEYPSKVTECTEVEQIKDKND